MHPTGDAPRLSLMRGRRPAGVKRALSVAAGANGRGGDPDEVRAGRSTRRVIVKRAGALTAAPRLERSGNILSDLHVSGARVDDRPGMERSRVRSAGVPA